MKDKKIEIFIDDVRLFQHLALLFDRQDFLDRIEKIRIKRLYCLGKEKNLTEQYSGIPQNISDEIDNLINDFGYPEELSTAITSAVLKGKVTNEDIYFKYEPEKFEKNKRIREYLHPILSLRVDLTIRKQRKWYWLNKNGYGYKRITSMEKISEDSHTTVASAIKSYKNKLAVVLPFFDLGVRK